MLNIPDENPYEVKDCWCNCGNINECEQCRDHTPCYACFFCNRLHPKPPSLNTWLDLYNTVPRCSCQYRIITQERIEEHKSNPERFIY